jgi:hypothetical protein
LKIGGKFNAIKTMLHNHLNLQKSGGSYRPG